MEELAKKYAERLDEIKKSVDDARQYFCQNVERYNKFMRFVFKSSITDDEAATLADNGRPSIEFNILESIISRLRGEFAKQEPALTVRAADGLPVNMLDRNFSETLDVIEAHLRCVFSEGSNDMLDYNIYSDLLAGGFSVMRVFTDYVNSMSMEQNIYVERCFDPTLTIFDPLARKSHKGDGKFCAELYPMSKDKFEEEFGAEAAREMKFTRSLSGFDWSYQNDNEKIVLVCDYYEKKKKREKICKLSTGQVIVKKHYEKFVEEWKQTNFIEQVPVIVSERITNLQTICRYRVCENRVLDYIETDYNHLPLVFVDGNSVFLKDGGSYTQMTRPYVYHGEGLQRLKNVAGQSLANEIENTIQHKFIVPIEAIPEDYQEAYQNVQKADTLVFNQFLNNDPNVQLQAPREVQRAPIPGEIPNTFSSTDQQMQTILGNYDAAAGLNRADMSGVSFARSAIQSNNASMPYVIGYIKGLNRVAEIIVDLIPKYYRTPRSLPILLPDGKRSYYEINKKGSLYMNYDPNHLQVKVEAGVNFSMQKEISLQTVIAMSQANQGFGQFFNEEGLPVILDNLDIRGIDQLKEKANFWMERQKAQQQQAMQAQQQQLQQQAQEQAMSMAALQKQIQSPTEGEVGAMLVQAKAKNDAANVSIKAMEAETKRIDTLANIQNVGIEQELKAAKIVSENERSAVDSAVKIGEHINKKLENITK